MPTTRSSSHPLKTLSRLADISKINAVAIGSVAKLDAVLAANIAKVNGLVFATGGAFLLDTYTGAAAAYSVRQLRTGETISMRIRRDTAGGTGDDDEADVAFDTSLSTPTISLDSAISNASGGVSASTFGEFVAASGYSNPDSLSGTILAYVDTWMDQSGNGVDAEQNTHGSQPQIYNGSAVITENGKPMLKSAAGVLLTAAGFDAMNSKVFSVASLHRTGVWLQRQVQTGVVTGGWLLAAQPSSTSTALYHTAGFSSLSLAKNGASYTLSGNRDNLYNDFEDQHLLYAAISGVAANSSMQLGYATTPDPYSMWNQQELIIYPSTSSHSQSAIETDINNYFSIY